MDFPTIGNINEGFIYDWLPEDIALEILDYFIGYELAALRLVCHKYHRRIGLKFIRWSIIDTAFAKQTLMAPPPSSCPNLPTIDLQDYYINHMEYFAALPSYFNSIDATIPLAEAIKPLQKLATLIVPLSHHLITALLESQLPNLTYIEFMYWTKFTMHESFTIDIKDKYLWSVKRLFAAFPCSDKVFPKLIQLVPNAKQICMNYHDGQTGEDLVFPQTLKSLFLYSDCDGCQPSRQTKRSLASREKLSCFLQKLQKLPNLTNLTVCVYHLVLGHIPIEWHFPSLRSFYGFEFHNKNAKNLLIAPKLEFLDSIWYGAGFEWPNSYQILKVLKLGVDKQMIKIVLDYLPPLLEILHLTSHTCIHTCARISAPRVQDMELRFGVLDALSIDCPSLLKIYLSMQQVDEIELFHAPRLYKFVCLGMHSWFTRLAEFINPDTLSEVNVMVRSAQTVDCEDDYYANSTEDLKQCGLDITKLDDLKPPRNLRNPPIRHLEDDVEEFRVIASISQADHDIPIPSTKYTFPKLKCFQTCNSHRYPDIWYLDAPNLDALDLHDGTMAPLGITISTLAERFTNLTRLMLKSTASAEKMEVNFQLPFVTLMRLQFENPPILKSFNCPELFALELHSNSATTHAKCTPWNLQDILSGSPKLAELYIVKMPWEITMNLESTSLKRLSLDAADNQYSEWTMNFQNLQLFYTTPTCQYKITWATPEPNRSMNDIKYIPWALDAFDTCND